MQNKNIVKMLDKNNTLALKNSVVSALEDAKAENIVTIDLSGKSNIADYMLVASGRSQRQVGAIASRLRDLLKSVGVKNVSLEGEENSDWVLMDAGDIIVHLFRPEVRAFYNLEKMWLADMPSDEVTQTVFDC